MSHRDKKRLTIHHMWQLLRAIFEFKNCGAEPFVICGAFSVTPNYDSLECA